ncbi:MAG: GDSL family lipase [Comamonadaceae bacterium]|nr:MAG: GDSL family lipase [Comamonadaceae bacterium]
MKPRLRRTVFPLLALTLAAALTAGVAQAQDPAAAAQSRWQSTFAAFDKADRERQPAADGVLFVGSSSIRFWTRLADDFRSQPVVINRGFGGSTMAECGLLARELVVRYKPRQVLVYAGDNDLAEGRTPLQVLESFALFASTVRAELPNVRIGYISVKPSPSRAALLPKIQETNNIVGAYLRTQSNIDYIDIYTPMMGADGRPRAGPSLWYRWLWCQPPWHRWSAHSARTGASRPDSRDTSSRRGHALRCSSRRTDAEYPATR